MRHQAPFNVSVNTAVGVITEKRNRHVRFGNGLLLKLCRSTQESPKHVWGEKEGRELEDAKEELENVDPHPRML